jgi:hypothetical protein
MKPTLQFTRIWADDDLLELTVRAFDGRSKFSVDVYVPRDWPEEIKTSLLVFRTHVHGGIFDLKAGEFGPEYASGALLARLHYVAPGSLFVSISLQGEFQKYKTTEVASEAKMYLRSEPVLLDRFIDAVSELKVKDGASVELECV